MVLEGLWRGWTNISMLFVGGLCAFMIGRLNEYESFYKLKMWQQCLIGTLITLVIEFISGLILNVLLGFHIWDYSDMKLNLYGQISLNYAFLWFFLMPLAIYTDDFLRWIIFKEPKPDSLLEYYKDLITNN